MTRLEGQTLIDKNYEQQVKNYLIDKNAENHRLISEPKIIFVKGQTWTEEVCSKVRL